MDRGRALALMIGRLVCERAGALVEALKHCDCEVGRAELVAVFAAQLGVDLAARFDPSSPGEFSKEGGAA